MQIFYNMDRRNTNNTTRQIYIMLFFYKQLHNEPVIQIYVIKYVKKVKLKTTRKITMKKRKERGRKWKGTLRKKTQNVI